MKLFDFSFLASNGPSENNATNEAVKLKYCQKSNKLRN